MSDRVTTKHLRKAGWCASGIRTWCGHNGIDFRRLVKEGIPISEIEHRTDVQTQTAIRIAREDR